LYQQEEEKRTKEEPVDGEEILEEKKEEEDEEVKDVDEVIALFYTLPTYDPYFSIHLTNPTKRASLTHLRTLTAH
jgi:hypothetical protein